MSPWAQVTPEQLAEAIAKLPPELRDVLEAWRRGCPYDVIARELSIPKNTVGTRLRRARLALRERLFGRRDDE
jgi:RNA polymerase sigma-70 factor (ECF subfamily)